MRQLILGFLGFVLIMVAFGPDVHDSLLRGFIVAWGAVAIARSVK